MKHQNDLLKVLQDVFKLSDFRSPQADVINAVLEGKNSLVLFPTGFGKSLCYQMPAHILHAENKGPTIVISPLIALMKDQVDAARKKGLKAEAIHSGIGKEEREKISQKFATGALSLLYVTPERFRKNEFQDLVKQMKPARLAIDEAHCISQWGHDFRPDYSRVAEIRKLLNNPPTIALTATATPQVQKDILAQLNLSDATVFNHAKVRENISIEIIDVHGLDQKVQAFMAFRHQFAGPCIIYFSLIQTLQKFSEEIHKLNLKFSTYHGSMSDRDRKRAQDDFLSGRSDLILATPAFGLGVDKENIRLIIHAEIPGSIEAFYQEIGRSGRDGKSAQGVVLFDEDDLSIQLDFIKWSTPDPEFVRSVLRLLGEYEKRAQLEGFDFLREKMNFYNRRDYRVETSIALLDRWGVLKGKEPKDWVIINEIDNDYLNEQKYAQRVKTLNEKLFSIFSFAKLSDGCRLIEIAKYFGFESEKPCMKCDLCLRANK